MPPSIKIKSSPTPSEQILAQAAPEVVVADSTGRKITLRKPDVLAQFRIVEIAGPDSAMNPVYMRMIMPLIYVTQIDSVAVFQPGNKRELEALISRLDEHGVDAVVNGVAEHFGEKKPDEAKDATKK